MAACEKCWEDAFVMSRTSFLGLYECYKELLNQRIDHQCSDVEQAGQFWNEEYGIDKRAMQTFQPYYLAYIKATKHNREKRSNLNYVNWITEKHREFRGKGNDKKTGDYSSRFLEWLNSLQHRDTTNLVSK